LQIAIILGLFFGLLIANDTSELIHVSASNGDQFPQICTRIGSICGFIFLFLALAVGTEIRRLGCVTFFRFVRWEAIESYGWKRTSRDYLILDLKVHNGELPILQTVGQARKEAVNRVLMEHLSQSGSSIASDAELGPGFADKVDKAFDKVNKAFNRGLERIRWLIYGVIIFGILWLIFAVLVLLLAT
jgi:hypothetical protein